MRAILKECGCDETLAIRMAKKQNETFENKSYHLHNPCTKVYELVRLLRGEDIDFNEEIKIKMNSKK